jgi:propionaldehyde dehydrogenase
MEITEQTVRTIVEQVMSKVQQGQPSAVGSRANAPGVFSEMDELINAARTAQEQLMEMSLEMRKEIIQSIRSIMRDNIDALCSMAVEETTFGNRQDKHLKNMLAIDKTPGVEDLEPHTFTDDYGLTLTERAPYGVIGSITPCTNPTETLICNGIGMVAAGNAVVFNPHPAAKKNIQLHRVAVQ